MSNFLLLNGPNLNLLGTREPKIYGSTTLSDVEAKLTEIAKTEGHELESFQSNAEHDLVDKIHEAKNKEVRCIIFNPGAENKSLYNRALSGVNIPFIEIHISNIYNREDFRQHSYLSDIAEGVVSGLGVEGYELALKVALKKF